MKHFKFILILSTAFLISSCSSENKNNSDKKTDSVSDTIVFTDTIQKNDADSPKKRNIVDYFRLLQKENLIDVPCELIKQEDGKFKCESEKDEAGFVNEFDVLVDIKNGYIQIVDEGTGGGTLVTETALFKTADKKDIIAVNTYFADGMLQMSSFPPAFYSYKDTSYVSLKNIFPETNPNMFFIKPYDLEKELIGSYYILPHYGTDIKFCLDSSFVSLREESFKKNIKTYEFTYRFDKEKGKFLLKE